MDIKNLSAQQIIDAVSVETKSELYDLLQYEHVSADVRSCVENIKSEDYDGNNIKEVLSMLTKTDTDNVIDTAARCYVSGKYDCNMSYWDNIETLIRDTISDKYVDKVYDVNYDYTKEDVYNLVDSITIEKLAELLGADIITFAGKNLSDINDIACDALSHNKVSVEKFFNLPESFVVVKTWSDDECADYISDKTGFYINGFKRESDS